MIHGGFGVIKDDSLCVSYELLRPLSIGHETRLFGIYYPSKYDSGTVKHDFVLSPIPYRLWPRIGRYVIRTRHGTTAIKEISDLLAKRGISILFSDAIRSGYRFDTWSITIAFESLSDGDELQYKTESSIYKETYDAICETKIIIEKTFEKLLFKDEKDIQLKDSVIQIPHTALPYFHEEAICRSKIQLDQSWMYETFVVHYDERQGAICPNGDDIFSPIMRSILKKLSPDQSPLVFFNADVRDMTLRAAIIPRTHQNRFFEARYDYERTGTPDTSRGILAHVLSRLPSRYYIWKMTNRMLTSARHQEKGSTSFIFEDCGVNDIDFYAEAKNIFKQIETEILPHELQHLRISDTHVLPLTANHVKASLEAEKEQRKTYNVFISYSSLDKVEADKIREALEKENLRCFMAAKGIKGGEKFKDSIRNALLMSNELCVLFTENSKNSEWVTSECAVAWALNKRIVPILLHMKPSELPDSLKDYQCIDLHQLSKYVQEVIQRQ